MIPALLPLFAALPLLGAGVLAIVRIRTVERVLLVLIPALTCICGVVLLVLHIHSPVFAHNVGDYIGGVAIVFVSDSLTAIMLTVTGFIITISALYLIGTGEDRYRFVPPLVLMLVAGVNGALLTGDLFNLFVFVEVMLLPSYALIAVTGSWRRLGVGRMFLIVNLVTSTILLIGIGLVYGAAGTVNLATLAHTAAEHPQTSLAVAIVLFALLVKAGVVPVHGWLVRAYPSTSAGIMALFAGVHTKVGLYAIYRIYATVYAPAASWLPVLTAVVVATIVIGALSTFGEKRIRGALAFQMICGVGQILIGIIVFTQLSIAAGLFYLVHHVVTMGALIMASGAIEQTYGSGRFNRLQGLMRREPLIAAVMAIGFFSLVGLPPTSGLWGKVGLLGGAAGAPMPTSAWLICAVVVAAVVSLMALQRVWREVFLGPPMKQFLPDDHLTARGERTKLSDDTRISTRQAWPSMLLIMVSLLLFAAIGVIWPFFERAADGLLDLGAYVKAVLG